MSVIRLYVPVDGADLADLEATGRIRCDGRFAYAVTPALEAATPRSDGEEREYLAFVEAAHAAADRAGSARRVVAAADVPPEAVDAVGDGALVRVVGDLASRQVASFHVDQDAGGEVADLLWYDVTELAAVHALVADGDQ